MSFTHPLAKNLITWNYVSFENIQLLSETFFIKIITYRVCNLLLFHFVFSSKTQDFS